MKLSNQYRIDLRSTSVVQLPGKMMSGVEMILPGGCTSTATCCCCSCGTPAFKS